jgi:hypothetical protein
MKREIERFERRGEFIPKSVNADARTIEVTWSTGSRELRDGYYEELSLEPSSVRMGRLNGGHAPFLKSHDPSLDSILGVVIAANIVNGSGIATVRFPSVGIDWYSDSTFEKIKDGIISNISVGYRVYKFERIEGAGTDIPVYRAIDWEPYEISLVSIGVDSTAVVRSEGNKSNKCIFLEREKIDMTTETENKPVEIAERELGVKAERERIVEIRKLVTKHKLGEEIALDMIERGISKEQAYEVVLEKLAERSEKSAICSQHSGVEVLDTEKEKFARGAVAGILARSMNSDLVKKAENHRVVGEKLKGTDLNAGEFRRMTLLDLAREYVERSGVSTRRLDRFQIVERALGQNSTSDFAILLGTAIHKILLAGYGTTPDTWSRFCGIKSVTDFRDHYFYRNGSFGTLDTVNESGEVHQKQIPDGERVAVSVTSKGNIIGLSRQAIVNDDMSAFSDLASRLGRAAALSIESAVYSLLGQNAGLGPTQSDSNPFFYSATRANVGSGAAISVASIDADRIILASQTDPSGNEYLSLAPSVLLVPSSLGGTARVINGSEYDPDTVNKLQRPNMVNGLFADIVDTPRLTGTRRYMFADPMIAPAIVVAFLEGQQSPILETQNGWRTDGIEWRVLFDFGVKEFDYRAAVTNAGA